MREWKLRTDKLTQDQSQDLLSTGLSPLTLQVCIGRNLNTKEQIQNFLNPKVEKLKNPYTLKDMDLVIARFVRAREFNEFITVFGDYDVDGTTGAALLSWFLREVGYSYHATQPDRFRDGYGLNVKAVEEAHARGSKIILTVDCGITSFDAALKAKELGVDLIVLDHHQIDTVRGLPKAYAIINPQREDCTSGLKELCGCGVAFYFARALRSKGRELKWWKEGEEPNLKQHLDLVTLATAADMVPLIGDNHILVRHGMEVLRQSQKPGVLALLEAAGIGSKEISPSHLGFVIGPRINASGRMSSASFALELLSTQDPRRAHTMAWELERLNTERASIQNQIWDEVRSEIEAKISEGHFKNAIVVANENWHEGVVGIVATRVTETFKKPAIVMAIIPSESGISSAKGSARTYGGKDVLEGLRRSSEFLKTFGGHRHAAGLSLELSHLDSFVLFFDQMMGELTEDSESLPLYIEGECRLEDLDYKTIMELERLGPFGPGHPEPVFKVPAKLVTHTILKGRHFKLNLTSMSAEKQNRTFMDAIWFNAAEREDDFKDFPLHEPAYYAAIPEINRFRGRATLSLRVKERQPIGISND